MKSFEMVRYRSLSHYVYSELKQQILTGVIPPRTRLMEIELSERLEVSRTPIREAFRMLEKEGLVVVEPRHGAYTSQVSKPEILNILEVRQFIDGQAAKLAALRGTPEDFEKIEGHEKEYLAAVKANDTKELIRYDEKFHEEIAVASGNNILVNMVTELQEQVIRFRYIYYSNPDMIANMIEEHNALLEAILSGDADKAEELAKSHVQGLIEFIEKTDSIN